MNNNNKINIQLKIGRIIVNSDDISTDTKVCQICRQRFPYIMMCNIPVLLENGSNDCLSDHSIKCNMEAIKERKRERNRKKRLKRKNKKNNNEVKNDNTKVGTIKKLFVPQENRDNVSQHAKTSN